MTDGNISHTQMLKFVLCENIGHKSVAFVMSKHSVIVDGYATAFLTSVLKRIKCQVNRLCNIRSFWLEYAKNTTFFV